MAEMNEIYTRIQLKYDSYNAWKTNNPTLLTGEVAIAKLVNENVTIPTDETKNAPVLFKVGPGAFNDLPWVSGLAADVYAWAKKATPDWSDFPALPIEIEDPDGEAAMLYPIMDITYADNKLVITRGAVGAYAINGLEDVKVKNAEHADTATTADVATQASTANKVDNALTIKVGGTDIMFDGSVVQEADVDSAIAAAEQRAKDYADAKPHENTAHTHSVGAGLAITGNGGITGDVKYGLNVAFELVDKKIKLYDKADSTKTALAELDATEFIADGMLESVTADQDNNKLVFKWNTAAGITETVVELSAIADIYTGVTNTETVTTVKNTNEIEVTLVNKGITEAKLEQNVQDALALARTALQEHQSLDNYKTKQAEVTKTGSTVKTVTEIKQNTNGEITEVKFEDIAFPEEVKASGAAIIATVVDDVVTLKAGAVLGEDHVLANDANADITLAKVAKTGNIADLAQTAGTYIVFNCGTSTTVI